MGSSFLPHFFALFMFVGIPVRKWRWKIVCTRPAGAPQRAMHSALRGCGHLIAPAGGEVVVVCPHPVGIMRTGARASVAESGGPGRHHADPLPAATIALAPDADAGF